MIKAFCDRRTINETRRCHSVRILHCLECSPLTTSSLSAKNCACPEYLRTAVAVSQRGIAQRIVKGVTGRRVITLLNVNICA